MHFSGVPGKYAVRRRGAGAVERGGLENRWACKRLVGSNPTPAAFKHGEACITRRVLPPCGAARRRPTRPTVSKIVGDAVQFFASGTGRAIKHHRFTGLVGSNPTPAV